MTRISPTIGDCTSMFSDTTRNRVRTVLEVSWSAGWIKSCGRMELVKRQGKGGLSYQSTYSNNHLRIPYRIAEVERLQVG
jgi:hypothetical protein